MAYSVFEYSSTMNVNIKDLFDFHLDTNNIRHITPPATVIKDVEVDPPIKVGSIVRVKAVQWMIPMDWVMEIQAVDPESLIVDFAVESPFAYWRHEHRFKETDEGSILTDFIEFKLPFGPLGLLLKPLIDRDLNDLFVYRHEQTKNYLENQKGE